jgi:hypothetical protein
MSQTGKPINLSGGPMAKAAKSAVSSDSAPGGDTIPRTAPGPHSGPSVLDNTDVTDTALDAEEGGPADGSLLAEADIEPPGLTAPPPKPVYPPEVQAQLQHLEASCTQHTRALRVLELQQARLGENFAPVQLILEIEDTKAKITDIKKQIGELRGPTMWLSGIDVLAPEQVDALRQSIADICGIAVDDITVLSAVLGSVIVTLRLPLVAAAQLLALHRARHPWATRAHIIDVQLLDASDVAGSPAADLVEQLAADEEAQLRAADPMADANTRLLLDALPLVAGAERRDALLARIDGRLAQQRTASAPPSRLELPPELNPLNGSATLRVTFSDAVRQAA